MKRAVGPTRVFMITDDMQAGGLQKVVVSLANEMAAAGGEVGVLARPGGVMWSELHPCVQQIPFHWSDGLRGRVAIARRLRREAQVGGWGIFHTHQRGVSLAARISVLGTSVPVVEHVHSHFMASLFSRFVAFRGHALVACGSSVGRMLTDEFGRDPGRIHIIPNSVPDLADGVSNVASMGRRPGAVRLTNVSRVSIEKNPHRFLAVVSELRKEIDVTATWVGDGPMLNEMRHLVDRRMLSSIVSFPGAHTDVAARLLEADAVLLTSDREGLPLTILEAMSMGRAVFAPDVGSCGDLIDHEVNGVVYDPDLSPSEIAGALIPYLDHTTLQEWGSSARLFFLNNLSMSEMTLRVQDVYAATIAGAKG